MRYKIKWEPKSSEAGEALKVWKQIPKIRRKIRAYFDQPIPASVAERVRCELGWDVEAVQQERSLQGHEDEFHYQRAGKEDRILFTLDRDFWNDQRFPLHSSPGTFILVADQSSENDIFHAIQAAAIFLQEAIDKIADLPKGMKVLVTLEGQTIRLTTHDSKVIEIFAPWFSKK